MPNPKLTDCLSVAPDPATAEPEARRITVATLWEKHTQQLDDQKRIPTTRNERPLPATEICDRQGKPATPERANHDLVYIIGTWSQCH